MNNEKIIKNIQKQAELKLSLMKKRNQRFKCYGIFQEEEFKILTNPITGETKKSGLCKKCLSIIGKELKNSIEKIRG